MTNLWAARKGCCEYPKPCRYHEGFEDGFDAASAMLEKAIDFGLKAHAANRRIIQGRAQSDPEVALHE